MSTGNIGTGPDAAAPRESPNGATTDFLTELRWVQLLQKQHWSEGWDVVLKGFPESCGLNGHIGRTEGYSMETGCFNVSVDGQQRPCSFEQLVFPPDVACSSTSEAHNTAVTTAQALFVPGSRFEGSIAIPGMCEGERKPYVLEVIREEVDELGNRVLLARHAAYDDEQSCHLSFEVVELQGEPTAAAAAVQVVYTDSETSCKGIIQNVDAARGRCTVRGRVMQLLQGEEGFYENSTEVTHFFQLQRITSSQVQAAHMRRLFRAVDRRLEMLCNCFQSPVMTREMLEVTREMPWEEVIFYDAVRFCEDRCATLRRQSTLLEGLSFATPAERDSLLCRLKKQGLNRAACHASNDVAMERLKTLLRVAIRYELDLEQIQRTCWKAQARLLKSYSQFDRSLRSAEGRLPQSVLRGWLQPRNELEGVCAVCYMAFGSGGAVADAQEAQLRLPCGHWFHFNCAATWLHAHNTCPSCRRDLADEEGGAGLQTAAGSVQTEADDECFEEARSHTDEEPTESEGDAALP